MNSPSVWTAEDVAAYLKVSRSWVYQQAAAGKLPSHKIVGVLRFNPDEIRALAGTEGAHPPATK